MAMRQFEDERQLARERIKADTEAKKYRAGGDLAK
jgi:hypothetical protein